MEKCKHENEYLRGTKDGVKCTKCGKSFLNFVELDADRNGLPVKKTRSKKKSV